MSQITYLEAIVVGALQGVSELFPVSSLGHSILLPAWIGGSWATDLSVAEGSPYLAVLVAMHVATALALVVFFWRDWVRIIVGLVTSIRHRRIQSPDERLAWLLIVATIPVGIAGLLLDKVVQNYLGKPVPAAIFLLVNGGVLYGVERFRRSREKVSAAAAVQGSTTTVDFSNQPTAPMQAVRPEEAADVRLSRLGWGEATAIGAAQIAALLPGISRSGSTITAGLLRGLRHDDAARFAFLLATPVILGAGLYKMPTLLKPEYHASLGPAVVGSIVAFVAGYISVRFLVRYFETRTLTPFAIYCAVAGVASLIAFSV
jgi:undecaprenyl-diphosphatase